MKRDRFYHSLGVIKHWIGNDLLYNSGSKLDILIYVDDALRVFPADKEKYLAGAEFMYTAKLHNISELLAYPSDV